MKRFLIFLTVCLFWVARLQAAPGDLKWAFQTSGAIRSSPALATNGFIIFGSHDFNVYALNRYGELRWKTATTGAVISSPAVPAGIVYVGVTNGLAALDLIDGTKRWHFQTNTVFSSPAIAANGSICVQDRYGQLYGLDPDSGQKKWQTILFSDISGPSFYRQVCYSSPLINGAGVLFLGASSLGYEPGAPPFGFIAAVDSTSGKMIWNLGGTNGFQSTGAIGADGTVYFGGFDKSVHAINPLTGVEKWSHLTGDSISASAAIGPDGTLFVGAHDGNLYAIDSQTGARKWKFLTGDSIHSSVAIASDGTIYFGSYDKDFYALDGSSGKKKWSFATGGFVLSSPVIGPDGTVYVGSHDGKLYAFEGSAPPADSIWSMFKGNPRRTGGSAPGP